MLPKSAFPNETLGPLKFCWTNTFQPRSITKKLLEQISTELRYSVGHLLLPSHLLSFTRRLVIVLFLFLMDAIRLENLELVSPYHSQFSLHFCLQLTSFIFHLPSSATSRNFSLYSLFSLSTLSRWAFFAPEHQSLLTSSGTQFFKVLLDIALPDSISESSPSGLWISKQVRSMLPPWSSY